MHHIARFAAVAAIVAASVSCGDVVRDGKSPVFLVIDSLQGSPGNQDTLSSFLISSVITAQTTPEPCSAEAPCLVVFNDVGSVALRSTPKDVTIAGSALGPTSNSDITITRYRVAFRRTDGRNTQGVDVPFAFEGATTGTVPALGSATLGFELVRHSAKREMPLVALVGSGRVLNTIADVTFFGKDRVGNDVSVTGSITVDFGDFRNQ